MIWSETPQVKIGWCWVKDKHGRVLPGEILNWPGKALAGPILAVNDFLWHVEPGIEERYLFGPPIPPPEVCHEIAKGGGA